MQPLPLAILHGTATKLPPISLAEDTPELAALKASLIAKGTGDIISAAREFHLISLHLQQQTNNQLWARRCACASASLMSKDGDRRTALTMCVRNSEIFQEEELFSSLIHSCRLRAEIGQVKQAMIDFQQAQQVHSTLKYFNKENDCRLELAHGRLLFGQGDLQQALQVWQTVFLLNKESKEVVDFLANTTNESTDSLQAQLVVSSICGNLGDFVHKNSKLARMEAGNNMALALLHLGQLDDAVRILEDVVKLEPSPFMVDGIVAANLKTLYDLQRGSESSRMQLPAVTLIKLG